VRRPLPPKPRTLAPVRPNVGLQTLYQRRLDALITEMHNSILYWLGAAWKANPPEATLAMDKSPAAMLRSAVRKLTRRWQKRFDQAAQDLADYFAAASADRSDARMKQILKDGGITVDFKMTAAMNDALQATIGEQVGLIRSIASEHLSAVEGIAMRSIQEGRNLGHMAKELEQRFGVTKRRAALISRDQSNKSTATFTRVRQLQVGITEAIWEHSRGGKHPRPEHLAASGKKYSVETGMWLEGKWTFPGREINCRCYSRPLIQGFDPL
jgi:SPP1 gp7 family putative phage head morphogenesis protein